MKILILFVTLYIKHYSKSSVSRKISTLNFINIYDNELLIKSFLFISLPKRKEIAGC